MTINTRYEIFEPIGKNDYLSVYRGWDARLRKYVAIMELDESYRNNSQLYEEIWDEVLVSASLEHDGFVRVYEVAKENGWIITELMHGNLGEKLKSKPLTNSELRTVLHTSLEALGWLHDRGHLHGDIRPSNLLINEDGRVRLSHPIGLAIGGRIPPPTMNQKYLAPELVNPEFGEWGPPTDLYKLGFSAYELLVGESFDDRFAWTKGGADNTSKNVSYGWLRWHSDPQKELPPIQETVPSAPDELATVIDRLVCRHVHERYSSAQDALEQLGDFRPDDESQFAITAHNPKENPGHESALVDAFEKKSPTPQKQEPPVQSRPSSSRSRGSTTSGRGRQQDNSRNSEPQPWTSEWIESKLQNPWVFRSLAAGVMSIAVLVGLALRPSEEKKDPGNVVEIDPIALMGDKVSKLESRVGEAEKSLREIGEKIPNFDETVASMSEVGSRLGKVEESFRATLGQIDSTLLALQSEQERQHKLLAGLVSAPQGDIHPSLDNEFDTPSQTNSAGPELGELSDDLDRFRQSLLSTAETLADFDRSVAGRLAASEPGASGQVHVPNSTTEPFTVDGTQPHEVAKPVGAAHELALSASRKLESGDYSGAIDDIREAIDKESTTPDPWLLMAASAYIRRGEEFYQQEQHQRAISDFTEAMKFDPPAAELALAYRFRGAAHVLSGKLASAIEDITTAKRTGVNPLRTWPKAARVIVESGASSFASEDYSEALGFLDAAIDLDRENIDGLRLRGKTMLERGELIKALPDLDQAISLAEQQLPVENSVYLSALYNRGRARFELGMYQQAEDDFTQILSSDPQYVFAYERRGATRVHLKEFEKALTDFDRALSLDPRSYAAYNNRGSCYLYLGRGESAVTDFTTAINIDESIPNAYFNRHLAHKALGNSKLAAADLAKSKDMSGNAF